MLGAIFFWERSRPAKGRSSQVYFHKRAGKFKLTHYRSPGLSSTSSTLTGITSRLLERQLDDARPEAHSGLHHQDKAVQVQRFGDETVSVQVVDFVDVLFGLRAGDDHHRDAAQLGVLLDFRQDFAAVLPGQAQVEQDEIGPRRIGVFALAVQAGQRLNAIRRPGQMVRMVVAQSFPGQPHVAGVVFDQQYLHELLSSFSAHARRLLRPVGMVNLNVAPSPTFDSTQILPPWRSTIFFEMARPMPVPGYSFRGCRRWKMTKRR